MRIRTGVGSTHHGIYCVSWQKMPPLPPNMDPSYDLPDLQRHLIPGLAWQSLA